MRCRADPNTLKALLGFSLRWASVLSGAFTVTSSADAEQPVAVSAGAHAGYGFPVGPQPSERDEGVNPYGFSLGLEGLLWLGLGRGEHSETSFVCGGRLTGGYGSLSRQADTAYRSLIYGLVAGVNVDARVVLLRPTVLLGEFRELAWWCPGGTCTGSPSVRTAGAVEIGLLIGRRWRAWNIGVEGRLIAPIDIGWWYQPHSPPHAIRGSSLSLLIERRFDL